MATSCHLPALPLAAADPPQRLRAAPTGAWRYTATRRSRSMLLTAAFISAGFHAGLLFGFGHARKKPAPPPAVPTLQLAFIVPQLKELEEPETIPNDDDSAHPDLGQPVPMQADVPSAALPTDFVQQFDFASLVEKPDLSALKMVSLPEHIRRPGKLMEGIKIFDLAALDRIPEAMVQNAPIYPLSLRRDGLIVTVTLLFHVEIDGRVSNIRVLESENHAFDDAAVLGVSKWRFRAGIKNGSKVVTRMSVPITFRTVEHLEVP
jgi:TonB family protein